MDFPTAVKNNPTYDIIFFYTYVGNSGNHFSLLVSWRALNANDLFEIKTIIE